MSNRRFIELSSATRNRTQYPSPSEFEVPFAPPRSLNKNQQIKGTYTNSSNGTSIIYNQSIDIADTITTGIVEYLWTGGNTRNVLNGTINCIDYGSVQTGSTPTNLNILFTSTNVNPYLNVIDYFIGYTIILYNAGYVQIGNSSIITSYNPETGRITTQLPLSAAASAVWFTIIDNSGVSGSFLSITLPGVDSCGKNIFNYDQAYTKYYIINETLSQTQNTIISNQILAYNFFTRTITILPVTGWVNTNQYSIRKTLPSNIFQTVNYAGLPITLSPTLTLTNNCIFLSTNANGQDNYYTGMYIYINPQTVANNQTTPLTNIEGNCFYINSYIGAPYYACFISPVNPNVNRATEFYPSYSSIVPDISIITPGTTFINIVTLVGDNYTPLIYNGSVVSQSETVSYEISLVNLTLPNISLITGSRAAFYPYLYVELSNVTASGGSSRNIIYSNNPNSYKALFLVPITDITDPVRTPFIKLDAGSMVQTIKFKPNDCLKFSLFLPNGQLYTSVMSDYYSPSGPNPLVQIDALFGIKRL